MKPATATKGPSGHGSLYKEVRFSPTSTPMKRSHSVPNDHPTVKPDHTRSLETAKEALPSQALGYLEQNRSLLDRQRANFDRERTLFAEERQLWQKERDLLKSRISELESLVNSRDIAGLSATAAPACFAAGSPSQVWEGSSPNSRPTRVFANEENQKSDTASLSPTEQGGPSLDAALSPKSHATEPSASIPVPIEKLDSQLDGITLKSSALHPDVVARVMTPPSPSSGEPSPTSSSQKPCLERRSSVKLKLSDLGPPETNLVRDAGHTPMVVIDRDVDTAQVSPGEAEALSSNGNPLAPRETQLNQPTERSDSYFSGVTDLPDDPALKGPLSLVNEVGHDHDFLKEVDTKLLGQAGQILGQTHKDEPQEKENETEKPTGQAEEVPEIKFKNTMNFGTAFGQPV